MVPQWHALPVSSPSPPPAPSPPSPPAVPCSSASMAGVLVVFAVLFFDKIKIDDPVGARLRAPCLNGIWGTLALGLFYNTEVAKAVAALDTGLTPGAQFMQPAQGRRSPVGGVVSPCLLTSCSGSSSRSSSECASLLKRKHEGLDVGEHGNVAYPELPGQSLQLGPDQVGPQLFQLMANSPARLKRRPGSFFPTWHKAIACVRLNHELTAPRRSLKTMMTTNTSPRSPALARAITPGR
jgi:hypothetical protein